MACKIRSEFFKISDLKNRTDFFQTCGDDIVVCMKYGKVEYVCNVNKSRIFDLAWVINQQLCFSSLAGKCAIKQNSDFLSKQFSVANWKIIL